MIDKNLMNYLRAKFHLFSNLNSAVKMASDKNIIVIHKNHQDALCELRETAHSLEENDVSFTFDGPNMRVQFSDTFVMFTSDPDKARGYSGSDTVIVIGDEVCT